MKIALHVEELALQGLGPHQGRALVEALRREVERLCASGGGLQEPPATSISRLDAGEVRDTPERGGMEAAGAAAGRALVGVIDGKRGGSRSVVQGKARRLELGRSR